MQPTTTTYNSVGRRALAEKQMTDEKRRQAGIAFPPPRLQDNVLVIRLDILSANYPNKVREGLQRLCSLLEDIDREFIEMDEESIQGEMVSVPLSKFSFTGTLGFGRTFFKKLDLLDKCPKFLYDMPNHLDLGDCNPYTLQQTDMILQLASNNQSVNQMVLQNDSYLRYLERYLLENHGYFSNSNGASLDILSAVKDWAKITDVHSGFHRTDKRNLMGFYDGISNPDRLDNDIIWIPADDELADGTCMIFQKIEHDLTKWHKLDTKAQERWVGRSKATGLLLGTLTVEEEKLFVSELHDPELSKRKKAVARLERLIEDQRNPGQKLFDGLDTRYFRINKNCPITSHVRKTNPRDKINRPMTIFRRGYLYIEEPFGSSPKSGLLFISFQKDIGTFEEMKKKMVEQPNESIISKQQNKDEKYSDHKVLVDNTFNTTTLGGGYYFIPRIPNKKISEIGQDFFHGR